MRFLARRPKSPRLQAEIVSHAPGDALGFTATRGAAGGALSFINGCQRTDFAASAGQGAPLRRVNAGIIGLLTGPSNRKNRPVTCFGGTKTMPEEQL